MKATPEIVTKRLREVAEASKRFPSPMQRAVDMSAPAVHKRLEEMASVSEAWRITAAPA